MAAHPFKVTMLAAAAVTRGGRQQRQHLRQSARQQPRERASDARQFERHAQAPWVGQHRDDRRAQQALGQRPSKMRFDIGTAAVDEAAILDARRAGGLAGQTGQATIDMRDGLGVRCAAALQHGTHQIDATARRVVLVTEQHISRTGLRTEAMAHTALDHALGFGKRRLGQLLGAEAGMHVSLLRGPLGPQCDPRVPLATIV